MKRNFPVYIITIGFIISFILFAKSAVAVASYNELVLSEFMFENGFLLFAECLIATVVYNLLKQKNLHRE